MKKTQFLDARRNIRKEFVAFISIVMIGLLAALAYLGIVYSAATLKKDALSFFNRTGFWDVEVTSTMLMTDEDLDAIRALENVREAERGGQVEGDFPVMDRKGDVTVEKGSVTVNGVSLTVCNSERDTFQVAIIPYTREITNFHCIEVGTVVNLEFDIIGKYLARLMEFAL